jgi:adenylate kinase family enzyme
VKSIFVGNLDFGATEDSVRALFEPFGTVQRVNIMTDRDVYSQPPRVADRCDVDGSTLVTREDDREEVIRERLVAYELQTKPVAEYYARKGRLVSVDGDLPVDEVTEQIFRVIEGQGGATAGTTDC